MSPQHPRPRPRRAIPSGARQAISDAAAVLAGVPPFSELSPVDRAKLAATLEEVVFGEGDVIFAQGGPGDALYILREGLAERLADGVRLDVVDPPAVFGDLALLRDEPRATTLIAATPCVVWRLPAERFTRLLERNPGIGARFAAAVSHRLVSVQRNVADLAQELEGIAERLYATLSPSEQQTLQRAALLPSLDARILAVAPSSLPLAAVLFPQTAAGPAPVLPMGFRRFLLKRAEDERGAAGLNDLRWQVARSALAVGALDVAVRVLVEGDLLADATAIVSAEAGRLSADSPERAVDDARRLVALLPPRALRDQPLLRELAGEGAPRAEGTGFRPAAEAPWLASRPSGAARWRLNRSTLGLALAGLALAVGWVVPAPAGLSPAGWHALASLIAMVPLLALDALPEGIVALGVGAVWVVSGVAPPRVALGGFATSTWVLVVSVLGVGGAIASSGLLYRMALWAIAGARRGFFGQAISLAVAGYLISPAVPNATSRITLIAPAATELVEALGYAQGSRAAAGLAMAVLVGFGQMVAAFLTSSSTAVLVFAVLPASSREGLSWGTWAVRALPTHLMLFLGLLAAVLWLYRPRAGDAPEGAQERRRGAALALQRELLGRPTRHELLALAVAAGLLVGFITQPLHGVDAAWLGVLALVILAATGLFGAEGLRAINWSFALLFGILTSMGEVFSSTGLDRWLAGLVTSMVGGLVSTPVLFVGALTLLCFAVSLVLRWQAAAPLLTISLAPVASSAGIDPWVVAMVALLACNGFFLPYQSTVYLALYHGTGGKLFSHRQARPAAIAYGVFTLLALSASVPLWRIMGLL